MTRTMPVIRVVVLLLLALGLALMATLWPRAAARPSALCEDLAGGGASAQTCLQNVEINGAHGASGNVVLGNFIGLGGDVTAPSPFP